MKSKYLEDVFTGNHTVSVVMVMMMYKHSITTVNMGLLLGGRSMGLCLLSLDDQRFLLYRRSW